MVYGFFGREIANHTVVYGAYILFRPTKSMCFSIYSYTHSCVAKSI